MDPTTSVHVNGLYVCVHDMQRALAFYETRIFGKPAASKTAGFAYFDIDGFLFCLLDPKQKNEPHLVGNNCVPTLAVAGVAAWHEKLRAEGIAIHLKLHQVGDYHLFQCKDSEGNILEFYEIKAQ